MKNVKHDKNDEILTRNNYDMIVVLIYVKLLFKTYRIAATRCENFFSVIYYEFFKIVWCGSNGSPFVIFVAETTHTADPKVYFYYV